jgi:myo-inositol catabolism protein IolS
MQYRQLGKDGPNVSAIALGCWAFAGDFNWGPQEDADSIATVHAALDAGVTLFDSAEGYGDGRSEEVLGRALAGRRHEALIATKVSQNHLAPAELARACDRSLKHLQTDYIDLYQIHWPSREIPLEDTLGAMQRLREQGKIRAIGVCNFGMQDMADLQAFDGVISNQLPYSLIWRALEFGIRERCIEQGLGIMAYMPLMQGLLTGKFRYADDVPAGRARTRHFGKQWAGTRHGEMGCEEATFVAIDTIRRISARLDLPMAVVSLAWVLQQSGVSCVLAGARKPEQLTENIQAAQTVLTDEVLKELADVTHEVKVFLGSNPDPYQSGLDSRFR